MFFASLCVTLAFAFFSSSFLKLKSILIYIVSLFLFFCAHLLLVFQVAGLMGVLNNQSAFLLIQIVSLAGLAVCWVVRGKPALFSTLVPISLSKTSLFAFLRQNPLLVVFTLVVDIAYAVNVYLIYQVPPNNNDSLYVHMARVGHWMQSGSFDHYPTYYLFQHYYPFNAQGLIHWSVLFSGSDHFAGYVQFSAAVFCALLIYCFARFLELSPAQGLFASAVWLTFPQVFFESTTTQVDLIVTAFVMGSFYLLFVGVRYASRAALILSGIALGIAIGTKQTAFFVLPALGLTLLGYVFIAKVNIRTFKAWLLTALAASILFGSIAYIRNYFWFGNFMGPNEKVEFLRLQGDITMPRAFALNTSRLLYQAFDTTALPPVMEGYLFRGKARLAKAFFDAIDLPLDTSAAWYPDRTLLFDYLKRPALQEDSCWFGIFSAIGLPILLVFAVIHGIRRKNIPLLTIPVIMLTFHLMEFLIRPGWDFYLGRNYLIPVTLAVVLFGYLYQRKLGYQILAAIVILLSTYMIINMVLNNQSKPLIGKDAIWTMDRFHKITLQTRFLRMPLDFVERKVPDRATIGLSDGTMEYLYFGEHFTRNLTAIQPISRMEDRSWLLANGIDYLLVRYSAVPQELNIPFAPLLSDSEWGLYRVE
jgi:4-amino-4-deoxy-L-arabinose transferase-like glycosyltransferase